MAQVLSRHAVCMYHKFVFGWYQASLLSQIESKWPSLSQLDRRICELFFFWDVFNVFLGAMFGGAIFSQLGTSIKDPGELKPISA